MRALRPTTDGVVVIRPPEPCDAEVLIAGRDPVFHRFLGAGEDDPKPAGCIVVGGEIVGWVDYDDYRAWRLPGEVNLGYNVFAAHRGRGYASRAVQLLMHHLAVSGEYDVATLLIHPENARSLALAARMRFEPHGDLDGNPYFKRAVPPLVYRDGPVTLRRQELADLDADLAKHDAFGSGPKWTFAVDAGGERCVAYADCDLANEHVPAGEANVSYSAHPAHRGRGYMSRAVRLVLRFLADHTGAQRAHLIIDAKDAASLRVASAVGAEPVRSRVDPHGRSLIHHALELRSRA